MQQNYKLKLPEMKLQETKGYEIIASWLAAKDCKPFPYQEETWQYIINGESGLVNAPTGCGKTYAVFLGTIIRFINQYPGQFHSKKNNGLQLIWITPLRALAKDIGRAMEEAIAELGINWRVGIRNGDTATKERLLQKVNMPEILIITPESFHLLLTQKNYPAIFNTVSLIAVDEWHELLGSKRGVQTELAISRIIHCTSQPASLWGISATIGNMEQAQEVLLKPLQQKGRTVVATLHKEIAVESIIPDEIETYPWAGHLGIKMAHKLIPVIEQSNTTLIFINTRGMSEVWYQTILSLAPHLAGAFALHHGSIEQELRLWVEEALHTQKLKAVVCTASLDLGVDFRPVDTVIQVGSPKGVARFLQRAGRSGHKPGDISKIYFLPTHSLELVEAAALKNAIEEKIIESKEPLLLCFDVLIQFLCTLAIGEGFEPESIFREIRNTYCFNEITRDEWLSVLHYITTGGNALQHYDEYKKVEVEDGIYRIRNKKMAMRHRMHIGTIVSDSMMRVQLMNGKFIGVIEEWFISRLEPGTVFTLAGRNLELVGIKDMSAIVKPSSAKKSIVPSWMGGRMSLTANLGDVFRHTFTQALQEDACREMKCLAPLFQIQQDLSHIPQYHELLVEHIADKDGYHLLIYPFEGRQVHEALSALLAYRIGKILPITFSVSMNDYGFELLSDQPIPFNNENAKQLLSDQHLLADIQKSINSAEMASRKFRDIAVIGGLIFQGFPGEQKKARHLQSSASLLFRVLSEYEPGNLLLRQAFTEVMDQQMEELRLRNALQRIHKSSIIITNPVRLTPLSFPIIVDGLNRNTLSSERMEERVKRMQEQLNKAK